MFKLLILLVIISGFIYLGRKLNLIIATMDNWDGAGEKLIKELRSRGIL